VKTEIITIARAPVLPPKHELSRKRDHFSIDIERMIECLQRGQLCRV